MKHSNWSGIINHFIGSFIYYFIRWYDLYMSIHNKFLIIFWLILFLIFFNGAYKFYFTVQVSMRIWTYLKSKKFKTISTKVFIIEHRWFDKMIVNYAIFEI